jgi:hypothetical protein
MLQPIPPIETTIWTPTIQDVWLRWYYAARKSQGLRCCMCEEVEEAQFLLAGLPFECSTVLLAPGAELNEWF